MCPLVTTYFSLLKDIVGPMPTHAPSSACIPRKTKLQVRRKKQAISFRPHTLIFCRSWTTERGVSYTPADKQTTTQWEGGLLTNPSVSAGKGDSIRTDPALPLCEAHRPGGPLTPQQPYEAGAILLPCFTRKHREKAAFPESQAGRVGLGSKHDLLTPRGLPPFSETYS